MRGAVRIAKLFGGADVDRPSAQRSSATSCMACAALCSSIALALLEVLSVSCATSRSRPSVISAFTCAPSGHVTISPVEDDAELNLALRMSHIPPPSKYSAVVSAELARSVVYRSQTTKIRGGTALTYKYCNLRPKFAGQAWQS